MALAYTAPTWEDGSGTGISASQLQALCNCVEGLVQGTDKAVHNITFSGSTMTLTFADGSQETAATSVKGVSSITKTGSSQTDPVVDTYTITYSDGTTSSFQITNGAKGDTGATPVITVSATADAIASLNPTVEVTKTGTDEAPHFSMAFSGLKGQTGPQGNDGADGYSPVVTVTNIPGGHRVNITDADHPTGQNFDVMNGDGAGDMLAQDYDSTSAVVNAGGIPAYVAANAMQTNGSNAASEVKFDGSFTVGLRALNSTVGTVSVSEGSLNTASGSYSHAEGSNTTASDGSAHSEGSGTTASGHAAHAEGWNTVASGDAAHAEGYANTTASGDYAHAEGRTTTASGNASHTEGSQTSATQIYAHAEGSYTTASNDSAHAEGRGTTASGQYSHAGGYYTTAGYSYQTAIGYYNSNKSTNVFEVGNGTDIDNKRNAFEVRKNGDINVQGQILRNGAPEYLENNSVTLSTSGTTTVTFTDAAITANSMIGYACTQWDIFPENITASAGTCTVTMPQVDTAVTVGVRIILR